MQEGTDGQNLRGANAETRKEAARAMGSARTERKTEQARINVGKARAALLNKPVSEETRALLSQKQQARRERERQAREALAATAAPAERKRSGRPRKEQAAEVPNVQAVSVEASGAKRARGRPKKQDGQTSAEVAGTPQNGTQEAQAA